MESTRGYSKTFPALWLFGAALAGQLDGGSEAKDGDVEILDFCLKHVLGAPLPPKPKCVDEYVLDNVYCFCQNKTKVLLDVEEVASLRDSFGNLIFYGTAFGPFVPDDNSNIFRSILFELFVNLVEIELWVFAGHRVNLLSLLSVLDESVIPSSFKLLKIQDISKGRCLKDHFDAIPDVKEQYAAKQWSIEFETIRDKDGREDDWIFIQQL